MRKQWNSLEELFEALNENCNYLILRNYEEMDKKIFFLEGHDDIDLLCENQLQIKEFLGAVRNPFRVLSKDHFLVKVGESSVKMGLRYVGDYYYDTLWEKDMLKCKRLHKDRFFVMDSENYFYSLLYHALLQKKKLSDDYRIRLKKMAEQLGIILSMDDEYWTCLLAYLKKKGYFVTYPRDTVVPLNFSNVPKEMLRGKKEWRKNKVLFIPAKAVRVISRRILKK